MSESQQSRWGDGPNPETIKTTDHRDMRMTDARLGISLCVGLNSNLDTALEKSELNSIYWFLTGDLLTPWKHIGTEHSPKSDVMRKKIADAAGFHYEPRIAKNDAAPKSYRRNQLRALLYALREQDDQRPYAQ